jgi:hypothetical protein
MDNGMKDEPRSAHDQALLAIEGDTPKEVL